MADSIPTALPPLAKTQEHLSVWHGETMNDPWFWLREKSNPKVIQYLEAENAYMEAATRPEKKFGEALYSEMLGRIQQTDLTVPLQRGKYLYYTRTEEGRQYPIHCRRAAGQDGKAMPNAVEEILLDLNTLSVGHPFLGLGGFEVSDDSIHLLYSTDITGFRQYTLYTKDLITGKISGPLADRVTSFEWSTDGQTVLYTTEDPVTKRSNQLWRLHLESSQPECVFLIDAEARCAPDTWEQRILKTTDPRGSFTTVLPRAKGHKYDVEHREGILFLRTNRDAKNFRLVTAPVATPELWTELIPHRTDVLLEGIELFRDHLVAHEQREALTRLRIHNKISDQWTEVNFPESVYSAHPSGTPELGARAFRLSYQSMATPQSVYDCDLATGRLTLLKRRQVDSAQTYPSTRWL